MLMEPEVSAFVGVPEESEQRCCNLLDICSCHFYSANESC